MRKFKVMFYREILCEVEITAHNETEAHELFITQQFTEESVDIVRHKDAEMVDEFVAAIPIESAQQELFH